MNFLSGYRRWQSPDGGCVDNGAIVCGDGRPGKLSPIRDVSLRSQLSKLTFAPDCAV
jgi:hypothetical protein